MNNKRSSDWLDLEEEESDGFDAVVSHNLIEDSKGSILSQRLRKRRKSDSKDLEIDEAELLPITKANDTLTHAANEEAKLSIFSKNVSEAKSDASPSHIESRLLRQAKYTKDKLMRTGVIYISRIPPFMKPQKVRHLLSPYGSVGRIFLTPEDATVHSRRVKLGGNKKRSYVDGWVEFLHKKNAKLVADALNAQPIGGRKGNWYHDDVWNIKYLKNFKWDDLTEQIASQNAATADKLRKEIAQTTKETNIFLENVEKARILDSIRTRKSTKVVGNTGQPPSPVDDPKDWRIRRFVQNEPGLKKSKINKEAMAQTDKVLKKIF